MAGFVGLQNGYDFGGIGQKKNILQKSPSDKKPPPSKKKTLINKYHPKRRLFYIKFRLGWEDNDILFYINLSIFCYNNM